MAFQLLDCVRRLDEIAAHHDQTTATSRFEIFQSHRRRPAQDPMAECRLWPPLIWIDRKLKPHPSLPHPDRSLALRDGDNTHSFVLTGHLGIVGYRLVDAADFADSANVRKGVESGRQAAIAIRTPI